MKITKSQLKQIIKEELNGLGGIAANLASQRVDPAPGDMLDSEVQSKAVEFFMNMGIEQKVSIVLVKNIAIPDLVSVMDKVPKIDTAAQEDEIAEVSSEKQRRWACAQKDKATSERADGLSAAEAEEMCKSKIEEDG